VEAVPAPAAVKAEPAEESAQNANTAVKTEPQPDYNNFGNDNGGGYNGGQLGLYQPPPHAEMADVQSGDEGYGPVHVKEDG
jgi:hypothetical protein